MKTKIEVYGREIEVKAGSRLMIPGWGVHSVTTLETCEYPELAAFRVPSTTYDHVKMAADIEITGRGIQNIGHGRHGVKVRIDFVDDGSDEVSRVPAWLLTE